VEKKEGLVDLIAEHKTVNIGFWIFGCHMNCSTTLFVA
jgi:hypothetical protein